MGKSNHVDLVPPSQSPAPSLVVDMVVELVSTSSSAEEVLLVPPSDDSLALQLPRNENVHFVHYLFDSV